MLVLYIHVISYVCMCVYVCTNVCICMSMPIEAHNEVVYWSPYMRSRPWRGPGCMFLVILNTLTFIRSGKGGGGGPWPPPGDAHGNFSGSYSVMVIDDEHRMSYMYVYCNIVSYSRTCSLYNVI